MHAGTNVQDVLYVQEKCKLIKYRPTDFINFKI